MKFIDRSTHALADFFIVVFLALIPGWIELTDFVETFIYMLAGVHLVLAIITDSKGGALKLIPFRIHGIIEFFVGIFLVASPWMFGFAEHQTDKIFILSVGFGMLLVFTFTRYKKSPDSIS